ncbi:MAG: transketolase [Saprospiraceae bacterium]|nr:transketolase [Saprospiraceae bacterium]
MDWKAINKDLRLKILELYFNANAGHIACSLSCVELLSALFLELKETGEEVILSKGHAAVALYAVLNKLGEITDDELQTFYKNGTSLPAHPAPLKYSSIPFATGSLGHGFPVACGISKALSLQKSEVLTYVLMSDGETNEGTTWEAAHFAVKHKLDNLIIIIDKNRIQGFGETVDVLGDTASKEKWLVFGFDVKEIDGHNSQFLVETIKDLKNKKNGKPKLIIANTIKGKGVSFMENTVDWHYWPMSEKQYEKAKMEVLES